MFINLQHSPTFLTQSVLLLGPHIPFLHQVLQLIGLKASLACHYIWLPNTLPVLKQHPIWHNLTSTSFWHNIKDLPQLMISNLIITAPSIFTHALTSNSFNWTSPDYHMDQHQLSESSHGMHTKFLPTLYDFPVHLRNSLSHSRPTLMPKVLEAKDKRMSDQSN